METENEIFNAIINGDEELAISLIETNEFEITKLNNREGVEENLLSTAVYYNQEKVVSKLLTFDNFQAIINEGINPFYVWVDKINDYYQELFDKDEHSFIEREIDLEKRLRILKLLLSDSNNLELPNDFLFNILPSKPIKNKLTTAIRNYDIFIEDSLTETLKASKVDKIINNKTVQNRTFLQELVKYKDLEEAVSLILNNKHFCEINNNNNTWYKEHYLWGLNVNNENAATACLSMNYRGKINDLIKRKSLLRIVMDERFDETLTIDLLSYLLRYREHLTKPNTQTELIFNQIERVVPLIINLLPKSEEYMNAYEELILIAAMYGKTQSLEHLINTDIPFSTKTYNLIKEYALRFPNKNDKTVNELEEVLKFKTIEETFKRNTSKNFKIEDELANHIFMYYTVKRIVFPSSDEYSKLDNIALENIISYFENDLDIITELNKLEEKYGCNRYFPIIDRNIKREKLSKLNQTREIYEYCMYRCFNPETEEDIQKLENAHKIAEYLIKNFELEKEDKTDSKPKIKQRKIPSKIMKSITNYKI